MCHVLFSFLLLIFLLSYHLCDSSSFLMVLGGKRIEEREKKKKVRYPTLSSCVWLLRLICVRLKWSNGNTASSIFYLLFFSSFPQLFLSWYPLPLSSSFLSLYIPRNTLSYDLHRCTNQRKRKSLGGCFVWNWKQRDMLLMIFRLS